MIGWGTGSRPRVLLALAVVTTLAGVPASAGAATVSVDASGTLVYAAADGEQNVVTVAPGSGGDVTVSDSGILCRIGSTPCAPTGGSVAIVPGSGCTALAAARVVCTGVEQLSVSTAYYDDQIRNATSLPATLDGGADDDTIQGGDGADYIVGGSGIDTISGGGGDDFVSSRGDFRDRIACGSGNDVVYADSLDTVDADCEDVIRPASSDGGSTGGGGAPGTSGGGSAPGGGGSLPVSAVLGRCQHLIAGTPRADRLRGTASPDLIEGFGGSDTIFGLGTGDCIFGGPGNDTIHGGAGGDVIDGGPGRDLVYGGAGDDVIDGGSGNDRLFGGAGNDRISGGSGANAISGGPGNDRITATGRGRSQVRCGSGRDRVRARRGDRIARDCERVTMVK